MLWLCVHVHVCCRWVMSRREGSSRESGGASQPLLEGIADDTEEAHSQDSPLHPHSTHT